MLIKPYTTNWVTYFKAIKHAIESGLNGLTYQIEHVRSTAIPNLAAKPIIDIDIIYQHSSEFEKIKTSLIEIGYYHNGNQGIDKREVFKRTGELAHGILDTIVHHLYVCPIHSEALARHILLRDFLRKNDWARIEYQTMKYDLAEKANQDKKQYAQLKEMYTHNFIDKIIEQERLLMTVRDKTIK